jgi:ribosome-associated heat shock protein Hsp15
MAEARQTMRLDKWLWHARFFKSRTLAAEVVGGGHLRLNSRKVAKPATAVGEGDTLTFPQARRIRIVRIRALSTRRGPAAEAVELYEDLSPPEEARNEAVPANPRYEGKGRPSKRDRRALDLSRRDPLE